MRAPCEHRWGRPVCVGIRGEKAVWRDEFGSKGGGSKVTGIERAAKAVRALTIGSIGVLLSVGLLADPGVAAAGAGADVAVTAQPATDSATRATRALTTSISLTVRQSRGRYRVVVSSDAKRVQVRWLVGRSVVRKTLVVKRGWAKTTAPPNARAIRARALRSRSTGGSGWVKPPNARPSWEDDGDYDDGRPMDPRWYESELVRLINEARSQGRQCGSQSYSAAAPLRFDEHLAAAARRFAEDEVKRGYWAFRTPEGVEPGTWATELGYGGVVSWHSEIGLSCGASRPPDMELGWMLDERYSCEGVMDPAINDVGVGYYRDPDTGNSRRVIMYGTSTG